MDSQLAALLNDKGASCSGRLGRLENHRLAVHFKDDGLVNGNRLCQSIAGQQLDGIALRRCGKRCLQRFIGRGLGAVLRCSSAAAVNQDHAIAACALGGFTVCPYGSRQQSHCQYKHYQQRNQSVLHFHPPVFLFLTNRRN